jgi:hypothetical protein
MHMEVSSDTVRRRLLERGVECGRVLGARIRAYLRSWNARVDVVRLYVEDDGPLAIAPSGWYATRTRLVTGGLTAVDI